MALTVGGDARGALLGGLRPWSRYQLRVLVFNGRGDGPPSEPIAFETPEGGESPPPPPQNGTTTPSLHTPPNGTPHPHHWTPPHL